MSMGSLLKAQLDQELAKLSEERLREVLDFVGYLLSKEQNGHTAKREHGLDPEQDPSLAFVGGVSHGMLRKILIVSCTDQKYEPLSRWYGFSKGAVTNANVLSVWLLGSGRWV
jgi:hypothetical protein